MKTPVLVAGIYIICFSILVYPFLPGKYDSSGIAFSTFIQIYSGIGLLAIIPAGFWLAFSIKIKNKNNNNQNFYRKHRTALQMYFWVNLLTLLIPILFIQFISRLVSIILLISLIWFAIIIWKKISVPDNKLLSPIYLPVALIFLPVSLLLFQLLISKPLTDWTRNKAILNSSEIIEELEIFKITYGNYPLTLNAINKDYETGINSIEKYHYTYDSTTYNLYFEQTRFFSNNLGTREFVVYNPNDNHLMVSHVAWHMIIEPNQIRNNQGWYASKDIGIEHWKSFFFD